MIIHLNPEFEHTDAFLKDKGEDTVYKIKNEIVRKGAVRSGNFLNSVAYELEGFMDVPDLLIDWISYGKYADYWNETAFSEIIDTEIDSEKFDNGMADALEKDIMNEINKDLKDEYTVKPQANQ